MQARIVVLGTSLGGLQALSVLLAGLPAAFALPLAIVQHRSTSSDGLAAFLQNYAALPLLEIEDKQQIQAHHVYLAPADYHVLVEDGHFALSTEGPVQYARPSIDVLFESTAEAYGSATVGVVLTGASADGAQGLAAIKRSGGLALVQSPESAECAVMPEAALLAVKPDQVLPLEAIAPFLLALVPKLVPHSGPL